MRTPVFCQGCSNTFERFTYYTGHFCGAVTDIGGELISVGDVLRYEDSPKWVFEVVEIPGTYVKASNAVGVPLRDHTDRRVLYTRLMRIVR